MNLGLKGVITDNDPIPDTVAKLGGEMKDLNTGGYFPIKLVTLKNGFSFKVEYSQVKLVYEILDSGIEISDEGKIYPKKINGNDSMFQGGSPYGGIELSVSYDGAVSIHEYVVKSFPLVNINDRNFGEALEQKLSSDPFIIVMRTFGLIAVIKMLNDMNRQDVIKKSLQANNHFLLISEILRDEKLRERIYEESRKLIDSQKPPMQENPAMLVEKGGIDLTSERYKISIQGDGQDLKMNFDALVIKGLNFDGVEFHIDKIQKVSNPQLIFV